MVEIIWNNTSCTNFCRLCSSSIECAGHTTTGTTTTTSNPFVYDFKALGSHNTSSAACSDSTDPSFATTYMSDTAIVETGSSVQFMGDGYYLVTHLSGELLPAENRYYIKVENGLVTERGTCLM